MSYWECTLLDWIHQNLQIVQDIHSPPENGFSLIQIRVEVFTQWFGI